MSSRVLGALCSMFLLVAATAAAAESYYCPDRTATVLVLDNENWRSDLVATSSTGASVRVSDCNSFSVYTQSLAGGGAILAPDFAKNLCSGTRVGVAHLRITNGCATYATEATFREGTTVWIPELTPLAPDASGRHAEARFASIENGSERSTFVALVAGGFTRAAITVYDGGSRLVGTEIVDVDGFVFHELATPLLIGRIVIRNLPPVVGPYQAPDLYAVTIVGSRTAGSPRVVPPQLLYSVAMP